MKTDFYQHWIFDLDNTLYSHRDGVFSQISSRMTLFIADHLELHLDDAHKIQKKLFYQHGTTLRGMMVEHGVDPIVFMQFVHDVDLSGMPANPGLASALQQLPGDKIIYTNASRFHAARVLQHLDLHEIFGYIHDIMAADYRPKPDPTPYQHLVAQQAIDPHRAVMVEDMVENLRPAKLLGMTTIWIDEYDSEVPTPDFVDYRTSNLTEFLQKTQELSR